MSARPKIQCIDHKDQIVTNFCTQVDCYRPLCPNCINHHIIEHKTQDNDIPEIKSFYWVLDQIEDDINKFLEQVEQDHQNIERQDQSIQRYEKQIKNKLAEAHKLVRDKVDEYFKQLFSTTDAAIRKQRDEWETKKRELIRKTQNIVKQNTTLKNQLNDPNTCISALYEFIVGYQNPNSSNASSQAKDLHELNQEFLESFKAQLEFQTIDVTPDLSKLEELRLNLTRFISPKNLPIDEYWERNRERIFERNQYSPRNSRAFEGTVPPAVIYDLNNRNVSPVRTVAPQPGVRIFSPIKAQIAPVAIAQPPGALPIGNTFLPPPPNVLPVQAAYLSSLQYNPYASGAVNVSIGQSPAQVDKFQNRDNRQQRDKGGAQGDA